MKAAASEEMDREMYKDQEDFCRLVITVDLWWSCAIKKAAYISDFIKAETLRQFGSISSCATPTFPQRPGGRAHRERVHSGFDVDEISPVPDSARLPSRSEHVFPALVSMRLC